VQKTFAQVSTATGLRTETSRPRIHDLRHSLVVNTVIGWQRDGLDVGSQLAVLSTYLGHVNPAGTYWYVTAVPELMQLAAARLEDRPGAGHECVRAAVAVVLHDRLIGQRGSSKNTISGYRDTFRLLLAFAATRTGKTPSALDIADLDAH